MKKTIGEQKSCFQFRLKNLRKAKGIKQGELAAMLNISPSMFSKYESGDSNLSMNYLILIAETLETTIDYLLGVSKYNLKHVVKAIDQDNSLKGFLEALLFKVNIDYFPELIHLPKREINEKLEKILKILTNDC